MGSTQSLLLVDITDPLTIYIDGYRYLVVPKFLSSEETSSLLTRSKELLDEFNIDDHPLVSRDDYYYHPSGSRIYS
jgi:hypothetical protein